MQEFVCINIIYIYLLLKSKNKRPSLQISPNHILIRSYTWKHTISAAVQLYCSDGFMVIKVTHTINVTCGKSGVVLYTGLYLWSNSGVVLHTSL